MDTDDMPDFTAAPPAGGGTADEILDEADELENLLEDALEEAENEDEAAAVPMALETTTAAPLPAPQPTPNAALGNSRRHFPILTAPLYILNLLLFCYLSITPTCRSFFYTKHNATRTRNDATHWKWPYRCRETHS